MFGDGQGSGADLAKLALRSAIRAWDGRGKRTKLYDLVLERTGFPDVPSILDAMLDRGYLPPLDLAELVFRAAALGDEVAIAMLTEQGSELGNAAAALIKRLGMEEERFDVVLGGSILAKSEPGMMQAALEQRVLQTAPYAKVARITMEPVAGAILSAMDQAGVDSGPETADNLRKASFYDLKGGDGS